jgi:ankyrin repeat protein
MIESGASIDKKDREGVTPLVWASFLQKTETQSKLLICAGANLEAHDPKTQITPLLWTAITSHNEVKLDVLQSLIKGGADINARDIDNNTALIHACNNENINVCKVLLESGALLELTDTHSQETALIKAAKRLNLEICILLVKAGADLTVKTKEGDTLIMIAAKAGHL